MSLFFLLMVRRTGTRAASKGVRGKKKTSSKRHRVCVEQRFAALEGSWGVLLLFSSQSPARKLENFGEIPFYSHPTRSFGEIRSLSNPWEIKTDLKRNLDGRFPYLLTSNPRLEASRLL